MPTRSPGVAATGNRSTGKDQGRIRVIYRDAKGRTFDAYVLSLSTDAVAGKLKLRVPAYRATHANGIRDNVPLATAERQTNVYYNVQP